jgi:hypothetical protein
MSESCFVKELIVETHPDVLFLDGSFDTAIMGVCYRTGNEPVIAYSYDKCIEVLMADGWTWEQAVDFFEFNIAGAYMGDHTPAFVRTYP